MESAKEHIPRLQHFLNEIGYRHTTPPVPTLDFLRAHHHWMHNVLGPMTSWTTAKLYALEDSSSTIFERAYPFADTEMKFVLAKLTAIAIFLDDSLDDEETYDDIGNFAHRVYLGEAQPTGVLTLYHQGIQELSKMHEGDPVFRGLAVAPWITFIEACMLEKRLLTFDSKLRVSPRDLGYQRLRDGADSTSLRAPKATPGGVEVSFPIFLRHKSGIGEAYAAAVFKSSRSQELPLSRFVKSMPDMIYYIELVNDLMSFYKEQLAGERANLIHLQHQSWKGGQGTGPCGSWTLLDTFSRLCDETRDAAFRVDELLRLDECEKIAKGELRGEEVGLSPMDVTMAAQWRPAFVQSLCREQRILRQGSTFTIDAADMPSQSVDQSRSTFKYRLTMLEPVLQGHADKDSTRVVILPASDDTPTKNVTSFNGSSITSSGDGVDDENDDLEIDESFLANSLNSHMPNGVEYHNAGPSAPDDNIHSSLMSSSSGHEFTAQPLPDDLVAPLASEFTVFVRTSDLPRIGIQDGDWALARSKHSIKSRLVRVKAHDEMVKTSGHAYVPLILLRNVFHEISIEDSKLHLQACPGGLPPSIPTAKTVTVARVASRVSTNRVYQQMLLQSLQDYFDRSKRLISQGDLLAVPVDIGSKLDTTDEEADEVLVEEHCSRTFRSDSLEHFVVTSIDSNASGVRHDRLAGDVYVGELGSWVDPLITRMLQTGVEHVRIPHHLPADIQASSSSERDSVVVNRKAFDQIYALTSATFSPQASTYDLPLSILLKGPRGTGKFTTAAQVAQSLGMQVFEINCYDILGVNDTKAEGFLRARFDQATSCAPCIIVMRHLDAFAQSTQAPEPGKEPPLVTALEELFADLYGAWRLFGYPVLVYGTTSEPGRVPPPISACFKHEVEFEVPGESERLQILQSLLSSRTIAPDVSLQDLARRTAALVAADLRDLVTRADIAAITRVMEAVPDECSEEDVFVAGMALTTADFDVAMNEARASYSQNIGAPTIPNVSWDDVGGLANVKSEILDTIQLPLEHPELFAQDLKKRSGILLYGPPGTGKTLLAKAVATSCSLNFFSVKGPELLNMYIGESEANVRRVFQRARDARPCVIFFDELDSVAPKRGNHGDSGGVMDRIVSQLLAELDGISAGGSGDVFVIGATNRPDLLDSALLRPGRFDRMLYLGVSDTKEAQVNILQALTRKFRLDPNLDWDAIVDKCTFNFTGADFYALCSDALLKAMSRKAEAIDQKLSIFNQSPEAAGNHPIPVTPQYYLSEIATPEEVEVTVSQEDFETALRELTPSVSQSEMEHYAKVQQRFSSTSTSKTTGDHDRDSDGGE